MPRVGGGGDDVRPEYQILGVQCIVFAEPALQRWAVGLVGSDIKFDAYLDFGAHRRFHLNIFVQMMIELFVA